MNKKDLRKIQKAKRALLTPSQRSLYAASIMQHLLATKEYKCSQVVFTYASMGDEVDTWALIDTMHADGKIVCIPRIGKDRHMEAVPYHAFDPLEKSNYGAWEPLLGVSAISPLAIDLLLLPALAITPEGDRLGYGGGYYDRYLPHTAGYKTALCFSCQMLYKLPIGEYDVGVDACIDETGYHSFSKANAFVALE